ncbi:hypothetical protein O6H91_11G105600 [Diphasiastrum complanatum]|uniref:Uncharacterized protein n=1 Tax=Diphasiastrum complanatum TaxID=34168 RepID=A0ACC2CCP4_DIPCM|nr:hypothetical protein O6H91_11G105600 [Diphasiastrum complanatum]
MHMANSSSSSSPPSSASSSSSSSAAAAAAAGFSVWDEWLHASLQRLEQTKLLRSLRPLRLLPSINNNNNNNKEASTQCCASSAAVQRTASSCEHAYGTSSAYFQTFDGPGTWDRDAVEMEISDATFRRWMDDSPSTGDEVSDLDAVLDHAVGVNAKPSHKLLLFSGNDYLGLSTHPSVRCATAKAALEFGMGPRGSPLICGYTYHHRLLESALADLKKTEECLLCPTGFAANMAVLTALASSVSPEKSKIAVFSDSLNHASIIDGIRISQRQTDAEVYVYRHKDMVHLDNLLSKTRLARKVVITDSLFSMDGDLAPMVKLVELRKKHRFLLVIDDAHGTLVCGHNGGGVAEAFHVEDAIDIHVGTLSKAVGCQGGFIATSQKWKKWIESKGRSFIFSTSLPVPLVAAAHVAIMVAQEEKWRQQAVWKRVKQLSDALGFQFTSPIVPILIGDAEQTLAASRHLLRAGFHVTAIRPPTVPDNECRLRITLTAAHSTADVKALVAAILAWLKEKGLLLSSSAAASNNLSTPTICKIANSKNGEADEPCSSTELTEKASHLKCYSSKL